MDTNIILHIEKLTLGTNIVMLTVDANIFGKRSEIGWNNIGCEGIQNVMLTIFRMKIHDTLV